MSDSELKQHPRGQIAIGGGELQKATMGRFTVTNNAKLKHTLRFSPSGYVLGNKECSGTIEVDVDEDGLESDWYEDIENGQRKLFRFKIPTLLKQIDGVCSSADTELPLDDACKLTVSFIGKLKPA
jgi:hypothetical protein